MSKKKHISADQAKKLVEGLGRAVTLPTVLNWIRKNDLGHQYIKGSRWYVDKAAFVTFLNKGRKL